MQILMNVTMLSVINNVLILMEAITVPVLKALSLTKIATLALVCKQHHNIMFWS